MAVEKNIKRKAGKGKQYPLSYKTIGKNIKCVKGDGNFGEENQDLKKWDRRSISSCSLCNITEKVTEDVKCNYVKKKFVPENHQINNLFSSPLHNE